MISPRTRLRSSHWRDFAVIFIACFGALHAAGGLEFLDWVADLNQGAINLPAGRAEELSSSLYVSLIMVTRKAALTIVRSAGGFQKNGAQSWKALLINYEPKNHLTTTGLFQDVLSFHFNAGNEMLRLAEFEESVEKYEKASGEMVGYSLKAGLILKSMANKVTSALSRRVEVG